MRAPALRVSAEDGGGLGRGATGAGRTAGRGRPPLPDSPRGGGPGRWGERPLHGTGPPRVRARTGWRVLRLRRRAQRPGSGRAPRPLAHASAHSPEPGGTGGGMRERGGRLENESLGENVGPSKARGRRSLARTDEATRERRSVGTDPWNSWVGLVRGEETDVSFRGVTFPWGGGGLGPLGYRSGPNPHSWVVLPPTGGAVHPSSCSDPGSLGAFGPPRHRAGASPVSGGGTSAASGNRGRGTRYTPSPPPRSRSGCPVVPGDPPLRLLTLKVNRLVLPTVSPR